MEVHTDYVIALGNQIQINQPTSEVLDALPNLAVGQPDVVPRMSVLIL